MSADTVWFLGTLVTWYYALQQMGVNVDELLPLVR